MRYQLQSYLQETIAARQKSDVWSWIRSLLVCGVLLLGLFLRSFFPSALSSPPSPGPAAPAS
jgi:hypothetical protein